MSNLRRDAIAAGALTLDRRDVEAHRLHVALAHVLGAGVTVEPLLQALLQRPLSALGCPNGARGARRLTLFKARRVTCGMPSRALVPLLAPGRSWGVDARARRRSRRRRNPGAHPGAVATATEGAIVLRVGPREIVYVDGFGWLDDIDAPPPGADRRGGVRRTRRS
jgi:hypothetical protein